MKIVFYDNCCGICHFSIRFLVRQDKMRNLFFAPIGGKTHHSLSPGPIILNSDSVQFFDGNRWSLRSTAVINALRYLGGKWCFMVIFLFIPEFFRDFLYDQVAKKRKRRDCPYELGNSSVVFSGRFLD